MMPPPTADEGGEDEAAVIGDAAYNPSAPSELAETLTTVDPSYIISLIRGLLPPTVKINSNEETKHEEGEEKDRDNTVDSFKVSPQTDPWEEYGCILWDLSANSSHAEFMVENLLIDVLLASLAVSEYTRIREICLGIIANLACHESPKKLLNSTSGLIETVISQLFLDDTPCLAETCRLLTVGLQGSGAVIWAEAIQSEHVLSRILWIAENTLNSQLLGRCMELFLTILESPEDVKSILLLHLIDSGLPTILVNILACEMDKLSGERESERCSVIDSILCVVEALSFTDKYSQMVSSNKDIFDIVLGVVKLPDKVEVSSSCVTAVVLIANILTDRPNLASEISQDATILQSLLDILPLVADDSQARGALWSVLARLLAQVEKVLDLGPSSNLDKCATVLVDKSDLVIEDLEDHRADDSAKIQSLNNDQRTANTLIASLARIASIVDRWITVRNDFGTGLEEDCQTASRLLRYCTEYMA